MIILKAQKSTQNGLSAEQVISRKHCFSIIQTVYITMEVDRIFSAEQIEVHPELAGIIKDYTKAVIKGNPDDLLEFSWKYFKEKAESDVAGMFYSL